VLSEQCSVNSDHCSVNSAQNLWGGLYFATVARVREIYLLWDGNGTLPLPWKGRGEGATTPFPTGPGWGWKKASLYATPPLFDRLLPAISKRGAQK